LQQSETAGEGRGWGAVAGKATAVAVKAATANNERKSSSCSQQGEEDRAAA